MAASWGAATLYPTGGTYLMDTPTAKANDAAWQRLNKAIASACDEFRRETGLPVHGVLIHPRQHDHIVQADVGWMCNPTKFDAIHGEGRI